MRRPASDPVCLEEAAEPTPDVASPAPVSVDAPERATIEPAAAETQGDLDVSKQQDLAKVMRDIHLAVDGVEEVVVATRDGLAVASTGSDDRTAKVAAMAASVVGLSTQAVGAAPGESGQTVIRGDAGCLVVQGAGPNAVIAVRTGARPNMGLVQVEVPRAADDLAAILA